MPRYLRGIFLCFLGTGLSQPRSSTLHVILRDFEPTPTPHVNEPNCREYSPVHVAASFAAAQDREVPQNLRLQRAS